MTIIYGIKNCDTIKKARKWLEESGVEYKFHDYRVDGISKEMLELWEKELGWESLLNTRGTTWRKLPDNIRDNINRESAIEIMLDNPAIIKRPLLDKSGAYKLGFKDEEYKSIFL